MVRESVRSCPREADARGPAFPHDLHSVTAVTLSVLHSGPIDSVFPGLEIQDFFHILGLLLPSRVAQLCGGIGSAVQVPRWSLSWEKGEEGKGQRLPSSLGMLGSAPHAYADTLASRPVRPSHLHMYVVSQSRSCDH